MSDSRPRDNPKPQSDSAGAPPRPPKQTGRGLNDESPEGPHIDIPDPVVVKELAAALRQKPFRIVADLLEFGHFASAGDAVDFDIAARIAKKYGIHARRIA